MSDVIISADHIGKRYILNHQEGGYRKFSDTLVHAAKAPLRWMKPGARGTAPAASTEEFWALKDVSFEIKQGEVVGIIGRNGAGKSTLLKVLSRITEPTRGRITLKGRVASLLEVGTGFHPELTGRENIFLNGAILGMRREEIKAKFDEIVAFAEIERFLDTPVKRYSSGMYVRLAFAVAAHLEPEILIVDEVLAVGDAQFQAKCLGKMNVVASEGRTVLLVSHNLAVVGSLCKKAILLSGGRLCSSGTTSEVLQEYVANASQERADAERHVSIIDSTLTVEGLRCTPEVVPSGHPATISLVLTTPSVAKVLELSVLIYNASGHRVAILDLRTEEGARTLYAKQSMKWKADIQTLPLVDGEYSLGLYCRTGESRGDHYDLGQFSVTPGLSCCQVLPYPGQHRGSIELSYVFNIETSDSSF